MKLYQLMAVTTETFASDIANQFGCNYIYAGHEWILVGSKEQSEHFPDWFDEYKVRNFGLLFQE